MKNKNTSVVQVSLVAALGGFLFGFDTGVIGGAQLYFTEYFQLTPAQQGWAVGSALYGCLLGALVAGYLTNAISRKYTLILSAILFFISAWGSGVAASLNELVTYRIIGGIGIGFASMAAPMYIAEVSPAAVRGKMVSLYQLSIVLGFFAVFLVTYFVGGGSSSSMTEEQLVAMHQDNLSSGWRMMFWSELLPATVFFCMLFFVPHSPRWLLLKKRDQEARQVLQKLYADSETIDQQLVDIKDSFVVGANEGDGRLLSKGILVAVLVGVMLSIFQQITGINAILYYGAEIFSNALGYGAQDALKQQLWLGAVNLVFTLVAIFTVDRWGRRPLYLLGTGGMFFGLLVLGITIYTQQLGLLSLISILVFIGAFALSMGPVVWVVLSEMFPNKVRSAAMAVAVGVQWLFNGIVANSFPLINRSALNEQQFNGALPYFIFAFFCIVAFIFAWRFLPETKGKSLEEIEAIWNRA